MPRPKSIPKPCSVIEALTGKPCGRDTLGLKDQCHPHYNRIQHRPDKDPGARPLGHSHPEGCPCDVHTKASPPKCEPGCTCKRHTTGAITCRIVCQGVRCGRKIGRGHGDRTYYPGNSALELCGGHDSRRRLNDGDTQDDIPLQGQHRGPDSERPRCSVEDCDLPTSGNHEWCDPHVQMMRNHGRLHRVNASNIGLTCSTEGCEKVCESGDDRFVKGMCAECFARFDRIGTVEKTVLMLKRDGIYRTCSVEGCDGDETGTTLLCKPHWNSLVYLPNGGQALSNAHTRKYRALLAGAESDGHSIPELHEYWRARGIDPKHCSYCDKYYRKWKWSVGDHVLALANGGSDTMDNIMPCCYSCNASKADRILYDEWTPKNMKQAA